MGPLNFRWESSLCVPLQVRSNAALALGSPAHYRGREQFLAVWEAVIQALGNSEQQVGDFSEYKHAATLKTQVTPHHSHSPVDCITHEILAAPPPLTHTLAVFYRLPHVCSDDSVVLV